jgi:putative peptidoglycan lipid II flippase
MTKLHKKSILKKTASVSASLLFSKLLGVVREVVQVSYLGVGELSDAFNTALKLPNLLRKIFAEGALSAAFVPTIIKVTAEDSQDQASKLMSLTYAVFGTLVLLLCLIISCYPHLFITLIAFGFADKPIEMESAISIIRILIYFVFFAFTSALLQSALQAKMHFAVPAWGPTLLNVFYIGGVAFCHWKSYSVEIFSYFFLFGGLVQALIYAYVYLRLHFTVAWPDSATYRYFKEVLTKFLPCLVSVSIVEINLIIDNNFASSLPAGSMTLLTLSSRFMMIALGAFAVAFTTILLPHFSRISTYAPKRLSFYLLESTKFIFWVIAPVALLMSFFAYDIFYTIFYRLTGDFSLSKVSIAASLLTAFLPGLFFFSVNKMLLSIFYALHETWYTGVITVIGVLVNVIFNRLLMGYYGAWGIATATVTAAVVQTMLLLIVLQRRLGLKVYMRPFARFFSIYLIQLGVSMVAFLGCYHLIVWAILRVVPQYADFLLYHIGLWLWVGPLSLLMMGVLYYMRNKSGFNLYFLE